MEEDVKEVVLCISSYIMKMAGIGDNLEENKKKVLENIQNKKAYKKFIELVEKQYGNINYLSNIEKAKYIVEVKSEKEGYVTSLNAEKIGKAAVFLGAGRVKKEDKIDYTCGIVLEKKIGSYVKENETLAYIHSNNKEKIEEAKKRIKDAYEIESEKGEEYKDILNII